MSKRTIINVLGSVLALNFILFVNVAFAATAGYTGTPSNSNNLNSDPAVGPNIICELFTAPSDMYSADSISGYMSGGGGASGSFAVWDVSTSSPGNLVANSGVAFSATSLAVVTQTYSTKPVFIPGNKYCVGYVSNTTSTFYQYTGVSPLNAWSAKTTANGIVSSVSGAVNETGGNGGGDVGFYLSYTPASSTPTTTPSAVWPVSPFGTATTTWQVIDNPNLDFALGFMFFLVAFGFVINWFKTRK